MELKAENVQIKHFNYFYLVPSYCTSGPWMYLVPDTAGLTFEANGYTVLNKQVLVESPKIRTWAWMR